MPVPRQCGYCNVEMTPGEHHKPDCSQFLVNELQRGDVVKTWFRQGRVYVKYTVLESKPHLEGGQSVLATSRFGTWRFRWWPGHYVPNRWKPVFVKRPPIIV